MKSTSKLKSKPLVEVKDVRREYKFDYSNALPNRFAGRSSRNSVIVLLDADVAKVFKTPEAVNSALRAIVTAIPSVRRSSRR